MSTSKTSIESKPTNTESVPSFWQCPHVAFMKGHTECIFVADLKSGDRFTLGGPAGHNDYTVYHVVDVHFYEGGEGHIQCGKGEFNIIFGNVKRALCYRLNSDVNAVEFMARMMLFETERLPLEAYNRFRELVIADCPTHWELAWWDKEALDRDFGFPGTWVSGNDWRAVPTDQLVEVCKFHFERGCDSIRIRGVGGHVSHTFINMEMVHTAVAELQRERE